MQITLLEIENFLSYESASITLADRGLVLIEGENRDQGGSNGAGKSTLFEAICWALFARLNNGLRGDDIRRLGSTGTRVAVTLDVDGRRVEVVRHRAHAEFTNSLHLFVDGEDTRGASDRETQARVAKLLQLDWSSFVSVVLFPQGKPGIAAWSDAEQKTVLDTVLSLARFNEARDRVALILQRDLDRKNTLEADVRLLTESSIQTSKRLESLEEKESGFEAQKKHDASLIVKKLHAHKTEEPPDPAPLQKKLENLQKQIEDSRQDDVINMVDQLDRELRTLEREQASDTTALEMLTQRGMDVVLDPAKVVQDQEDCPSCGQTLPDQALQRLLATYTEQAAQQSEQNDLRREKIETLHDRIEKREARRFKTHGALESTKATLVDTSALEKEAQDIDHGLYQRHQEIQRWLERKKEIGAALESQRSKTSPYTDLIVEAQVRLETTKEKLEAVEKELAPLKDDIQYLEFWKVGFGKAGVKNLLLSTVTPFLNERANIYMDLLSRSTASIRIKTQKAKKGGGFSEKLDFRVTYNNAGSLYAAKSGGEKRRADLSILFAFADLAATRALAPIELRLLDEPFENLDSLGCEQVIELLLEHVVPRSKTVFVMSHSEDLKALFEQRITVVKENGISRIIDTR